MITVWYCLCGHWRWISSKRMCDSVIDTANQTLVFTNEDKTKWHQFLHALILYFSFNFRSLFFILLCAFMSLNEKQKKKTKPINGIRNTNEIDTRHTKFYFYNSMLFNVRLSAVFCSATLPCMLACLLILFFTKRIGRTNRTKPFGKRKKQQQMIKLCSVEYSAPKRDGCPTS